MVETDGQVLPPDLGTPQAGSSRWGAPSLMEIMRGPGGLNRWSTPMVETRHRIAEKPTTEVDAMVVPVQEPPSPSASASARPLPPPFWARWHRTAHRPSPGSDSADALL